MKESCSEERPLPRARQVDSNAIDDASPLQCHPFVSYGVGNFPTTDNRSIIVYGLIPTNHVECGVRNSVAGFRITGK